MSGADPAVGAEVPTATVPRRQLDAASILAAADVPPAQPLYVPEWGGTVFVKTMSGRERDAFEAMIVGNDGQVTRDNFRARLAVFTLCREDGTALFSPDQAAALGRKSARALSRVFDLAAPLNGITDGDVAELTKNSDGARSDNNG